jgi:hypothetical protein
MYIKTHEIYSFRGLPHNNTKQYKTTQPPQTTQPQPQQAPHKNFPVFLVAVDMLVAFVNGRGAPHCFLLIGAFKAPQVAVLDQRKGLFQQKNT